MKIALVSIFLIFIIIANGQTINNDYLTENKVAK